jgi:hypothetical protein
MLIEQSRLTIKANIIIICVGTGNLLSILQQNLHYKELKPSSPAAN